MLIGKAEEVGDTSFNCAKIEKERV